MGQYWQLVNLDKRETLGGWGKLGEFLFYGLPEIVKLFATPSPRPCANSFLVKNSKPYTRSSATKLALGRLDLAPELLYLIFENIHDIRDLIFLTLSNTHLSSFGYRRLYELICSSRSWTGDRIICLGDYMDDDDLPRGVITEEELDELYESDDEETGSLYNLASQKFKTVSISGASGFSHKSIGSLPFREDNEYRRLCQEKPHYASATPEAPWALCNISKREYVRGDATAALSGASSSHPFFKGVITFSEIIIARTCWSSDSSTSMAYQKSIHRGAWAGDRFEVTMLDRLVPPLSSGEWNDVTVKVLDEMVEIWNSESDVSKPWQEDSTDSDSDSDSDTDSDSDSDTDSNSDSV